MASQPIYQFYVELEDYKPKMWRRFQVVKGITMARLGYIIMTMFEMEASHLFCFQVGYDNDFETYEIHHEDNEFDEESVDAKVTKVNEVIRSEGEEMTFIYDYGDEWRIRIVLEKIIIDKELDAKKLPRVLAGEGYGIIEDCGGSHELMELAKAFAKKKGTKYKQYSEWLGVEILDLCSFDIDDMNFRLKKVPKIYADSYEKFLTPTKKSLELLTRQYLEKDNS